MPRSAIPASAHAPASAAVLARVDASRPGGSSKQRATTSTAPASGDSDSETDAPAPRASTAAGAAAVKAALRELEQALAKTEDPDYHSDDEVVRAASLAAAKVTYAHVKYAMQQPS